MEKDCRNCNWYVDGICASLKDCNKPGIKQFNLRYEKWDSPIMGELGTIRTVPENYYVASVFDDQLTFNDIEACTRDIDKDYVSKWALENIFKDEPTKIKAILDTHFKA